MAIQTIPKKFKHQEKLISRIIRTKIIEIFREILADPDYGLELKNSFTKKLEKSIQAEQKGKVVSLDKILRKYNF